MKNPILKWRMAQELTQMQVAERLGVGQPAVAKWEEGKVSHSKALAVHQLTGIPLHELRPDIYPTPQAA